MGASEPVGYGVGRQGTFDNDHTGPGLTVFAGLPEPTTWAFMILSFGGIGGAMRRRPRTTVA